MCSQADVCESCGTAIDDRRYFRAALAASATDEGPPVGCGPISTGQVADFLGTARPAVPALEPRQNHCPGCDGGHS